MANKDKRSLSEWLQLAEVVEENRIKAKGFSESERKQYIKEYGGQRPNSPKKYRVAEIMAAEETGCSMSACAEAPLVKHGFDAIKRVNADAAAILLAMPNKHVYGQHLRRLGSKSTPDVVLKEYANAIKADDVARMKQIAGGKGRPAAGKNPVKQKVLVSANLQQQCDASAQGIYQTIHGLPQCRKEALSGKDREQVIIVLEDFKAFIERQINELTN